MKTFSKIILLLFIGLIFMSCGQRSNNNSKAYRFATDGLLYYKNSDKLYTGTVQDTTSMILQYEVVDGKKHGSFLVFFPDGKLAQSGYIIDNQNQGEWKYYYNNGNLESKGIYVNDKPQGIWEFYFPDGTVKENGKFKNGLRDREWFEFNEEGSLINIYYYNSGKLIGTFFNMS